MMTMLKTMVVTMIALLMTMIAVVMTMIDNDGDYDGKVDSSGNDEDDNVDWG